MIDEKIVTKKRVPLLATLAAFLMPGLGQLYNGQATKALLLFLAIGIAMPVCSWLALQGPDSALWWATLIGTLIVVVLYIYTIADAFIVAKRTDDDYKLQGFNRTYIYMVVFILGYFVIYADLANYSRGHLLESFRIPSQSMLPNVLPGDFILADKRVNCLGCKYRVNRGDLAIFVSPNDRTRLFIKRIIALPGDTVEINSMDVKVNGVSVRSSTPVGEDEQHYTYSERSDSGNYKVIWKKGVQARQSYTLTVPNGHVFTLGDNRDATRDSRHEGPIPMVDVVGKAKQVWFSYDGTQGRFRWERIGKLLNEE